MNGGAARALHDCQNGCGRQTYKSFPSCYYCKNGVVALGEQRSCDSCGRVMKRVFRRRTCTSCTTRARHASGGFRYAPRGDRWTPVELDELRSMAGKYTVKEIANRIGRTIDAVYTRAHMIGVYLDTQDWSLARLSVLFGTDERTIKRTWIKTGILPCRKVDVRTKSGGEWRFRDADIELFILTRPWEYDAEIMCPRTHRLVQLARRVQRRDPWLRMHDVAQRFSLSTPSIRRFCLSGLIPFQRRTVGMGGIGGKIVIREAD